MTFANTQTQLKDTISKQNDNISEAIQNKAELETEFSDAYDSVQYQSLKKK